MGEAFVCDRCDNVHRGTPSLAFNWQRVPQGADIPVDGDVDLCSKCCDVVTERLSEALSTPEAEA